MSKYAKSLYAAALFFAVASESSFATEFMNIPAAAAASYGMDDNCERTSLGVAASDLAECRLEVPLNLPVGKVVKQVSVVYGESDLMGGGGTIYGGLYEMTLGSNASSTAKFYLPVVGIPSTGTATTNLMAQVGTTYPDAFQLQSSRQYSVYVVVSGAAAFTGLRVAYE